MKACLFCDALISNDEIDYCSHQHKVWYETYRKRMWEMKNRDMDGLRWGAIGSNSSYDAMMEVHRLFNPENVNFNNE